MAFYRIYRPKVLEEVDNEPVRAAIESLLSKPRDRLPHAYLFTGPKGTGKTTAARIVAKLFNCERPTEAGAPCGVCEQCNAIAQSRHEDVVEIDAASNTGVDNIRDLRERVALTPIRGGWRVYIIDEVHMLSTGAFNALLKTLEEPPRHAIFILATTDPQKIPSTISSRCHVISFTKARADDLMHALKRVAKEEKIAIDEEALSLIVQYADGSFRDAVKMLEHVSFHKGPIDRAVAQQILTIIGNNRRDAFLSHFLSRDRKRALEDIRALAAAGSDIKTFLADCLCELQNRLLEQQTTQLTEAIDRLLRAYADLRISPIAELPLELAVVEYCAEEAQDSEQKTASEQPVLPSAATDPITLEKLTRYWGDVISEVKPLNHSIAAVMRSTRPREVANGIVTIEAFYPFHREKLSEEKTRDAIATVLQKLFGETVKVNVVLGKK